MKSRGTLARVASPGAVRLNEHGGVPWRDIWIFVLLAYGLAWLLWSTMLPDMIDTLRDGRTPEGFRASAAVAIGMYAPALAAVVMRLVVSREGLKGVLGTRPRVGMVLLAVFLPMAWVLFIVAFVEGTGIGQSTPDGPLPPLLAILLVAGVPVSAILAFGEEFGWRGYLLPKLLPLGEVKAAVTVALIWGPWHLPVLLVGLNYPGENVLLVILTFQLSVLMLSILHARLFVASGASLVIVALLHGSLNNFSDRLTDADHLSGSPLVVGGGGVLASLFTAPALLLTYRWLRRQRRHRRSAPRGPR
jgi:membrane protease YdiL (CAAX protease family)